jgi:hypothetical protein
MPEKSYCHREELEASHDVTKLPTITYESVISRAGLRP